LSLKSKTDFVTGICSNKKVLHVGFTDHPFTEQRITDASLLNLQLKKITAGLCGIDLEAAAGACCG
jgi:hypothetical protein